MRWKVSPEDLLDEVAVRIEYSQTFAVRNVLPDEIIEQGRFPGAGCTDHVQVSDALFRRQTDFGHLPAWRL